MQLVHLDQLEVMVNQAVQDKLVALELLAQLAPLDLQEQLAQLVQLELLVQLV